MKRNNPGNGINKTIKRIFGWILLLPTWFSLVFLIEGDNSYKFHSSALPFYIGLMAIAGLYFIYDSTK